MSSSIEEHLSKRVANILFSKHIVNTTDSQNLKKNRRWRRNYCCTLDSGAGFRHLDGVKKQGHVFQSEGSQTRKPSEQEEMIAGRRFPGAGRAPGLRSAALVRTLPLLAHGTRAQRIGRPPTQAPNRLSLCATVKGESRF